MPKSKTKITKDCPIVYIEWTDACNCANWAAVGKADTSTVLVKSVGWLMEEHDDRYVISTGYQTEGEDRHMTGFFVIPKAWVKEFYEIDV